MSEEDSRSSRARRSTRELVGGRGGLWRLVTIVSPERGIGNRWIEADA